MKILWLCSWYPHSGHPYEGDFIQRHARAVSQFTPLTVIYVCQDGIAREFAKNEVTTLEKEGLSERQVYFKFRKTGFALLDKIIYNLRYYKTSRRQVRDYIAANGRPDVVHVHVPVKAGLIAKWIRRKWGIPYIVSEHSSHYHQGTGDDFFLKSFRYQNNVKQIFRQAELVTNVSQKEARKLQKLFHLPKVEVVRNTVNTALFYYDPNPHPPFRFIHVSTLLDGQKNITGILNATLAMWKRRKDFQLVLVGPPSALLKQQVAEQGLDEVVQFTGEISYPDVARQMQQASAFILFSRYENFPCVIIEALCCGLPVIATDTGGISEAIDDSNGLLVEVANERQLADAMNSMMESYANYDRAVIASRAAAKYSYDIIGKEFVNLYAGLNNH